MDGWSKEASNDKPSKLEQVIWYVTIHAIGLALGATFQHWFR